jgi:hypothetical protein
VDLAQQAAWSLQWINLLSGAFFSEYYGRFKDERRADRTLLENLAHVRERLAVDFRMDLDVVHDLLARIIFIQFLFDRRDSSGTAALNEQRLLELYLGGELSSPYTTLSEILENYEDSYRFFRWLNTRFNGDLFPGKGASEADQEHDWQEEMRWTSPEALRELAQFVSGTSHWSGQMYLWPQYSFDAIPLEFISSIYEQFVQPKKMPSQQTAEDLPSERGTSDELDLSGVHYTTSHIVDFILDGVLPWSGTQWDLRILDPSCGSGIFLVKAYQRLIHRWRRAHPSQNPSGETLRDLLASNLWGVDIDRHAARVASFSLYLAMCDEIDPRDYWTEVRFPVLRGKTIIAADFFSEDTDGIRTEAGARSFDLVVGNAPWGRNTATGPAKAWAKANDWPIAYGNIGPLFMAKAARLVREDGHVAMLQPASILLYNRSGEAVRVREKLFTTFKVEEVVNFAALRRILFINAGAPTCSLVLRPVPPNAEPIAYVCPKAAGTAEDFHRITVESHDVHLVYAHEAATDPWIWTALMWGGRRDLELVRRLSHFDTVEDLKRRKQVRTREGIIRGKSRQRDQEFLRGKPLLGRRFPEGTLVRLNASELPINDDVRTDASASTDFSAFALPQLIIKQGWLSTTQRFAAAVVNSSTGEPVLCSQSYVTVTADSENEHLLEAACLSYNSQLAVYYLLLTSGRFAFERAEPLVEELLQLPIPPVRGQDDFLKGINTEADVDQRVLEFFGLKPAERVLIEDLVNYTLPDYKAINRSAYRRGCPSPGRMPTTRRSAEVVEPEIAAYCDHFLRVFESGFDAAGIRATIFQESHGRLSVRAVAIYLEWPERDERISVEEMGSSGLEKLLEDIAEQLGPAKTAGAVFHQRVVRAYHVTAVGDRRVPTVYLIKPDQARYWTRSMGYRDADAVAADSIWWTRHQEDPKAESALA